MTKTLLSLILAVIFTLFLSPQNILAASNLETSTDVNFSNRTTDFNGGQTVYVKVSANNNGNSKHVLNLRDNQYNQLASYNLVNTGGDQFSANFTAPQNEGYYSLESQIESDGSKSASVKTIKVGNPSNTNISVKVDVHSRVEGQSISTRGTDTGEPVQISNSSSPSPSPVLSPSPDEIIDTTDYSFDQNRKVDQQDFLLGLRQFFIKIWQSIWPFK